ncbi:MAG: PorV/PorQ family protein [Reichenbachiella sp.]
MTHLHLKIIAFFCLVCFHTTIFGQTKSPKYSNEFLAIGVDARALGMGGAYTSIADDVSAGYWNPAGLNSLSTKYEVALQHSQYFAGIANYDYLGFATQIDSVSSLALSVIRLGIDDIPDTRFLYDANGALNYDNIQFFSAADYAFLISYARKLSILGGVDVGANAKIIYRTAGSFATAWGYGLDIGISKSIRNLKLGLMLRDVTGTYNTWSHNTALIADIYTQTGNDIPENSIEITLPRAILGVSYQYQLLDIISILASVDIEATFDGQRNTLIQTSTLSIDPKAGLELGYANMAFLRFGVGQFQQIQDWDRSKSWIFQPNFGVGVKLNIVEMDYALSNIGNQADLPYTHVISLKIKFNDKK